MLNYYIKDKSNPNGTSFSLILLADEVKKTPSWRPILSEDDIFPLDKMDIDPILKLTSPPVITKLLSYPANSALNSLGHYLYVIRLYYDLWNNNAIDMDTKIDRLVAIATYYEHIETHTCEVGWHIQQSISALIGLTWHLDFYNDYKLQGTSYLSTLVVENFFSQVFITWLRSHTNVNVGASQKSLPQLLGFLLFNATCKERDHKTER